MNQREETYCDKYICSNCQGEIFFTKHRRLFSVYSDMPYELIRCSSCGIVYTSPRPSAAVLQDIYAKSYSYEAHNFIDQEKRLRAMRMAHVFKNKFEPTTVLDCGCMYGHMLAAFENLGVRGKGIETNPEAVAIARKKNLNIDCSTVEDFLTSTNGTFDLILLSHSLEHFQSPRDVLIRIKRHLSHRGHLVVIVPNTRAYTAMLFRKYWGYWQVPVHLQHYDSQSLSNLLRNAGYTPCFSHYFGADSLFFLSTICNLLGIRKKGTLGKLSAIVIQFISILLRKWYFFGNEDLCIAANTQISDNKNAAQKDCTLV